ncbi:MAG: polysaccharide biosynthesis protein, partial [Chloroflexota bacterium]
MAPLSVRSLSLRRNFSWTLLGNVIYAGCQWAMLVVIAKLGTPVMVGQFALALAIVMPVIIFANLQMRGLQSTDARREFLFGDYLAVRLLTAVLALVIIGGIVLIAWHPRETVLVIMAVALTRTFDSLSDVFYGLVQQHERMDRIAISLIIQGTVQLAALAGIVFLTRSLLLAVLGMAVISASVLVLYDFRSARMVLQGSAGRDSSAIGWGWPG